MLFRHFVSRSRRLAARSGNKIEGKCCLTQPTGKRRLWGLFTLFRLHFNRLRSVGNNRFTHVVFQSVNCSLASSIIFILVFLILSVIPESLAHFHELMQIVNCNQVESLMKLCPSLFRRTSAFACVSIN